MKPEKIAEVRAWLKRATNDLRAADIGLHADPPLLEDVLFHCQQAVEKAMKGFLTAHDRVFRKTHDLDELGSECVVIEPGLAETVDATRDLTVFAWEFRYPGNEEVPDEQEARKCYALARKAFDEIVSRLPKNTRQ